MIQPDMKMVDSDSFCPIVSKFGKNDYLLCKYIETVPKKMRLAKKGANNGSLITKNPQIHSK